MTMVPLDVRMRGRWRDALTAIGIDGKFLVNRQGPCPVCGGKDRFRWDNKENRGTFYCNGCGAGSGVDLARKFLKLDFPEVAKRLEGIYPDLRGDAPVRERSEDERRGALRTLWRSAQALDGTDAASRYLTARTGAWPVTAALKFHPTCAYYAGAGIRITEHPALIAAIQAADGTPVGLHRTYLTNRGGKAQVREPKKTLGELPEGCAIRLGEPGERLAVAEGVENALSVTAMFLDPCWAMVSANRMAVWTPPPGVKTVAIYGDTDASFTGQAAAFVLAKRLRHMSIDVEVHLPPAAGVDWNDIYRGKTA